MNEQSQNESQPKVRRAKNDGAQEPQPSVTGAENAHKWEASENVSEKFLDAGEDESREIGQVGSALPWPFQATEHALSEWTHFFGRATERNSRAVDDLSACDSITSLLQWQSDLIQSNVEDWLQTSFRSWAFLGGSFSHITASETAATSAS
jgi:hypothetical protein